jgi:hypothetical protein
MIGLVGAPRVGKTSLAKELSAHTDIPLVLTSSADAFTACGFQVQDKMTLGQRLEVQNKILDLAESAWRAENGVFITDRTPMDMAAYMLAYINGDTSHEAEIGVLRYLDRCVDVTNRYFSLLVCVQPGIPIVPDHSKAVPSKAYMHHINALVLGLMSDQRIQAAKKVIHHDVLSMEHRLTVMLGMVFDYFPVCRPEPEEASSPARRYH